MGMLPMIPFGEDRWPHWAAILILLGVLMVVIARGCSG